MKAPTRQRWAIRGRRAARAVACTMLAALVLTTVPARWCGRQAGRWFEGCPRRQAMLARDVERWIALDLSRDRFTTGSSQFNGEWLFGTYLMAGLGLLQTARQQPDDAPRWLAAAGACIDRMLSMEVRAFDAESWGGEDPLDALDCGGDHAAYLGYLNLLLGAYRSCVPDTPHAAVHDRITAHLAARMQAAEAILLQTYPGEAYPVDNCAVAASVGLHARLTTGADPAWMDTWRGAFAKRFIDPRSGLLIQSACARTGAAVDWPRASGTALGLYLLSFWDAALSRSLFDALRRETAGTLLGFGGIREYPPSVPRTILAPLPGDIDSGPLLFGYGFSATGFGLAGCRLYDDPALFHRLFATAWMAGAPIQRGDRLTFVSGGPLGNAILLAMLTAVPGGWSAGEGGAGP